MLYAKTEVEFKQAEENSNKRYAHDVKAKKGRLWNFQVRTELIPNPRKYMNHRTNNIPTHRQTMAKEQILTFEQYLSSLNILKCPVCLECHIEAKPDVQNFSYMCSSCMERKDPNFSSTSICTQYGTCGMNKETSSLMRTETRSFSTTSQKS